MNPSKGLYAPFAINSRSANDSSEICTVVFIFESNSSFCSSLNLKIQKIDTAINGELVANKLVANKEENTDAK